MSESNARDEPDRAEEQATTAARLFDIRRIIGGLFLLYGVVVLGAGLVDGAAATEKAAGIDINVWTGLSLLVLGAFFLVWMKLNPVDASDARDAHRRDEPSSRADG